MAWKGAVPLTLMLLVSASAASATKALYLALSIGVLGAAAVPAGGPGVFDPAMAAWQQRVKALIHSNWSGSQICKGTPIFELEVDSAGGLESLELATSSGDRYCDESAERAVRKSVPLPASPRGAIEIELVLNPKAVL